MKITKKSLRTPFIAQMNAINNRYIPHQLYKEIKNRKKCKLCGKKVYKKKLQIHHKVSLSQGGKSDYQNCIGVCKECHKKIHNIL